MYLFCLYFMEVSSWQLHVQKLMALSMAAGANTFYRTILLQCSIPCHQENRIPKSLWFLEKAIFVPGSTNLRQKVQLAFIMRLIS